MSSPISPKGTRPSPVKPPDGARRKRIKPKKKSQTPLGNCLLCQKTVIGPSVIRLQHGAIKGTKWGGTKFAPLPFEDGSKTKLICLGCANESFALCDSYQLSKQLDDLSEDGQCCLCKRVIEPQPSRNWSSAILLEYGMMKPSATKKGHRLHCDEKHRGHLHYDCMEDLNVNLRDLVDHSGDSPSYSDMMDLCG